MPTKPAIAAVFLLSLAVWIAFRVLTPDAPLTAGETAIVVAICGGLVMGFKRAVTILGKKKVQNEKPADADRSSAGGGSTTG